MGLPGSIDRPRPENFGVTAEQVEQAPELFVTRYRLAIFAVIYLAVFAVVFTVVLATSESVAAALIFGLILVAAGSIVIIPLVVCCLCASEKAETRWVCRRFPAMKACLAYREALAEFTRRTRRSPDRPRDRGWWIGLSASTFRGQVQAALERRGLEPAPVADRQADGYDYAFDDDDDTVLVRCEGGTTPVDIGVGRELTACLLETGAARAVLVTPAGVSRRLAEYLADRPIDVVEPEAILGNPPAEL
jgi:hypothetical protein